MLLHLAAPPLPRHKNILVNVSGSEHGIMGVFVTRGALPGHSLWLWRGREVSVRSRAGLCWHCVKVRGPPPYWHSEKDKCTKAKTVVRGVLANGNHITYVLTWWSLSLMHAICRAVRPPSSGLELSAMFCSSWGFIKT